MTKRTSRLQLRARTSFLVKSPPVKKYSVGGLLVPTVRSAFGSQLNTRRLCIDFLAPVDDPSVAAASSVQQTQLQPNDVVVLRILKPKHNQLHHHHHHHHIASKPSVDWTMTSVFTHDADDHDPEEDEDAWKDVDLENDGAWQDSRCFPLQTIREDSCLAPHIWEGTMGELHRTEVREFRFASPEECQGFIQLVDKLRTRLVELRRPGLVKNVKLPIAEQPQDADKKDEQPPQDDEDVILGLHESSRNIGVEVVPPGTDIDASLAAMTTTPPSKQKRLAVAESIPFKKQKEAKKEAKTKALTVKETKEVTKKETKEVAKQDEVPSKFLLEIVSGSDLPIADLTSSDPYVKVWSSPKHEKLLHRTKPVMNSRDPIWSLKTHSLGLVARDDISDQGLVLEIKDYDTIGTHATLGTVAIPKDDIFESKGERVEYELNVTHKKHKASKSLHAPRLVVRFRPSKKGDEVFLKTLRDIPETTVGVYANSAFVPPISHSVNRFNRETKSSPKGTLHRVKPGPDPARKENMTKWMTKQEIETEHLKPSKSWIECGSGDLGLIYVEILACNGLPNLDTGLMGDRTDAFVSVVYQDALVNTDVINDELSPRWMPWCQRAFVFHMEHPTKQLLLGVFDYDVTDAHDPIGRVTVDLSNFNNHTEYVLTYNLFESVLDEVRPVRGTITLRLRLDVDLRKRVLASAKIPYPNYINVTSLNDFRAAFFVMCGEENFQELDMDALKSYGNELKGYLDLLYYIQQAMLTVLLWRGHFPVNIFGLKFKLAIHSIVAFTMGIFVVEDLDLVPGFCLFGIAWSMLAMNEQRQRHPSPWHQSATFGDLWSALLFRKTKERIIERGEKEPLIKKYESELNERRKTKEEKDQQLKAGSKMVDQKLAKEESEAEKKDKEVALESKAEAGISLSMLNPLKPILLPIQTILGKVCVCLRVVRSIATWEENGVAFLLTNVCLLGGFILIWIPWSFLIQWSLRIVVWVFLGPWMKLVDWLVVKKLQAEGDNMVKRMESNMEERSRLLKLRKRLIMTRKENALKLKDLKRYMFGDYSIRVPQFKEYRYPDVPLPQSTATAYDPSRSSVTIIGRKHGQRLKGHMIPVWGNEEEDAWVHEVAKEQDGLLSLAKSPFKMLGMS